MVRRAWPWSSPSWSWRPGFSDLVRRDSGSSNWRTTSARTAWSRQPTRMFTMKMRGRLFSPPGARRRLVLGAYGGAFPPPSHGPVREVAGVRSEEHTSELQSPCNLLCRLLLEKNNIQDTLRLGTFTFYLVCQHSFGSALLVQSTPWTAAPSRVVPAGAIAVHQFAHITPEPRRI